MPAKETAKEPERGKAKCDSAMNREDYYNCECRNATVKLGCDHKSRVMMIAILNTILATMSILWHWYLHVSPAGLFYDPAVPAWIGIAVGAIDIGVFLLMAWAIMAKGKMLAWGLAIVEFGFVAVGFVMMGMYAFPVAPTDAIPLSLALVAHALFVLFALGSI